ncbi:MAG: EpsD family peptidyl-prolyl cis-trans isomerase [Gammaproteobacteria bacterium]
MPLPAKYSARALVCATALICTVGALPAGAAERSAADQPAATVNGATITTGDVGKALSRLSHAPATLTNEQAALEGLINNHLFLKQARKEKLQKDPEVRKAIEAATQVILVRAYVARHTANLPEPTAEQARAYFDKHPELFSKRRIYRLQEVMIAAKGKQLQSVNEHYGKVKNLNELVKWLKGQGIRYRAGSTVKAAEDIPYHLLSAVANLKDGQALKFNTSQGTSVVQLVKSQEQPLTFKQAEPAIERYLHNQEVRKAVAALGAKLRQEASIKYFPPFDKAGK